MSYSTISAETFRTCRATSFYNDFLSSVHRLIGRMKKKGAEVKNIIDILSKMIFQNTKDFLKFNFKQEDFIKSMTS